MEKRTIRGRGIIRSIISGIILYSIIFFVFSALLQGAIPESERAALIAFYKEAGGDAWKNKIGWKTPPLDADGFAMPGTEGYWYGVTVQVDHVRRIEYQSNNLEGVLTGQIADLTYLRELVICKEKMSGGLPPGIQGLSYLNYIHLWQCYFSGTIPAWLGNMKQLIYLNLAENCFTGSIPPELGNPGNLQGLCLDFNKLTGTIPPELGKLSKLSVLALNSNQLSGDIPVEIFNLTELTHLSLSHNQLTGVIPPQVGNLKKLSSVYFSSNQLTGSIPPEIGNCTALTWLYVGSNKLTGSIPEEIGNLRNMQYLSIRNTDISGSIPASVGNMAGIIQFHILSNPNLTGPIPAEIANFTKARQIWMGHNQLTGTIPSEVVKCVNLEQLILDANKLEGAIPRNLDKLTKLKVLRLEYNDLTGTIPVEIGNLSNLTNLRLCANRLEGSFPVELCKLVKLVELDLYGNNLLGLIPDNIVKLTALGQYMSFISNNGLFTENEAVRQFCVDKFQNWEWYQTVPPKDVEAVGTATDTIRLTWTKRGHLDSTGGYIIYYREGFSGSWLHAGTTESKLVESYDVSGLNAGTTYTFFIQTRTDPYWANKNTVISVPSEEVSATTLLPSSTSLLTVQSSPYSGIGITVSPGDYHGNSSGTTSFTRLYDVSTAVTLTAPATDNGNNFIKWTVDGVDVTQTTIQVSMSTSRSVIAYYEKNTPPPPDTYRLTVLSSPEDGAVITVSPNDNDGNGNGTTGFTRTYNKGTAVTLTAPAELNGNTFKNWLKDGVEVMGQTLSVSMDANHSITAVYEVDQQAESYTLTVQSTHGQGCPVTVTPADENGETSGQTNFTRKYTEGTVVTLTAPAEHNDQKFDHWTKDGVKITASTGLTITVSGDHKVKAYYVTPARPGLVVRPGKLNFGCIAGEDLPPSQTMRVTLNGSPVDWSAEGDVNWLSISPASGYGSAEVRITLNRAAMALGEGSYSGTITVTAPDADHSPQTVTVNLKVYGAQQTVAPVGQFATPIDGSTVYGSIAVTGWVVDDIGIESVKIYREGKNKKDRLYIGDAMFVEGARPDVEELYPEYPNNASAGWGYMLLTNFLPDGGNGTFVLYAIARDIDGHEVTLGTKTITCDNANAVKPFGAIDTPAQGGTASGEKFINWGWVLTPQSNSIPADGSTISVWVDGMKVGNPVYNIYREDIASLFPGYANSDGAVGYFYLDTTLYENGVHTIQWLATDSAGNTDGIGSRYFVIQNSEQLSVSSETWMVDGEELRVKGERTVGDLEDEVKDEFRVEIEELEMMHIDLGGKVLEILTPLPVGSTLDRRVGKFHWSPGAGFVGIYEYRFLVRDAKGRQVRKRVSIRIKPGR